jgi:hypothetical protein
MRLKVWLEADASQLAICVNNETLPVVAMRVSNPDRLSAIAMVQ